MMKCQQQSKKTKIQMYTSRSNVKNSYLFVPNIRLSTILMEILKDNNVVTDIR